ncbi:hypothetical protein [Pseudosulfitobacter sp. DSM 107133]|uniref:hypothetical protein n=1 Tax=Pseudosulfitobacter sp. DSM 107133 TaxID=2883100 RepID=UPI0013B3A6A0|nr:hypothetical protein [Pseudosulfitobacter sp. DSM 107133]
MGQIKHAPPTIGARRHEPVNFIAVTITKQTIRRKKINGVRLFWGFKGLAKTSFPIELDILEIHFTVRNLRTFVKQSTSVQLTFGYRVLKIRIQRYPFAAVVALYLPQRGFVGGKGNRLHRGCPVQTHMTRAKQLPGPLFL